MPTHPIEIMPMPVATANRSSIISTLKPSAVNPTIITNITPNAMAVFLATVLWCAINTLFILVPFRRGNAPAIGLKLTLDDKIATTDCEWLVELGTAKIIHHRIAIIVEPSAELFGGDREIDKRDRIRMIIN